MAATSSIQVTSVNSSSVTFKLTLSKAFNLTNDYIEAGITDVEFVNGSSELPGSKYNPVSAPSSGTSTQVSVTVTGLKPETTYYFYGYTFAKNGCYYCVGDEVEVTTDSADYSAPIIESFDVEQVTPYSNLEIAWSFYAENLYWDVTTYKVQARKKGDSGWITKVSGVISEDAASGDMVVPHFNVTSVGEWEFRFILDNDGVTTISDVITLNVVDGSPIIHSFSVEQVSPYINKEISWTYSVSYITYGVTIRELQVRKKGVSTWTIKSSAIIEYRGMPTENITVPDVGDWEFRLIFDTNGVKRISDIVTLNVIDGLTITGLTVRTRGDMSFSLVHQGAEEAEGFNIKITRNYDGYEFDGKTSMFPNWISWRTDDEEWEYGVRCILYIQAYNKWGAGEWVSYEPFTTSPAQPVISLSQNNGYISVDFEVKNLTNITHMIFELYNKEDWSLVESGVYTVTNGEQNPSGVYQFQTQCENGARYYVSPYSVLNFKAMDLPDDFDGTEEIRTIGDDCTITITISSKPELWAWTQMYELSTGGTGTICPNAYIPIDEDGVHPCTASEWKKFAEKINEVRIYMRSKGVFVDGGDIDTSWIVSGADFKTHYNVAVNAIKQITGAGGDLQEIKSGDELNSHLFTFIASELNYAITNL